MYRIETGTPRKKWRWVCPTQYEHTNWRVVDGLFECRQCQETFNRLRNIRTGEEIPREQIEVVGPDADHKGEFGKPTVTGGD